MHGEIQGHGTRKRARIKSAKLLLSLVVVLAVSYMPYFLISYFVKLGIIVKSYVSEYIVDFYSFCCF
jgi:uncharacterized protein (UPF0333 family)